MPSDRTLRAMNLGHRMLLAVSRGRLGWRGYGMPVLALTTVGRRSGRPHTVMLTSPYQEGSTYVVVASRGGDDQHPAWYLNLRDNPLVDVAEKNGRRSRVQARIASAEERARIWPRLTAAHPLYAGYQRRTDREIPVVLLDLGEPGRDQRR